MFTKITIYKTVDGEPLERFLATMEGVQAETHGAATEKANQATGLLRARSENRSGASKFVVERLPDEDFGSIDWFVTFDDTDSDLAPQIIDLGTKKQAGKQVLRTVFELGGDG